MAEQCTTLTVLGNGISLGKVLRLALSRIYWPALKALIETANKRTERVFLVGVELKGRTRWEIQDSLDELAELATTAGGKIAGTGSQKLDSPVAATFIGSGKAEKFAQWCAENEVDTVIFDDE